MARAQTPVSEPARVHHIFVHGDIELGIAAYIERGIREAVDAGASAVFLDIDTPGGRVDAAQRIVDAVDGAELPVYAFVNPRAFSAGAMIALATDRIYMVPIGVIGAATPVTGDGEKAPEKIVSAMRSEMAALAQARGLDPQIARAMVDEDVVIDDVVEAGKLLTLTATEAESVGYARAVADWDALMAETGLSGAEIVETRANWAEGVVRFLTHPIIAPLFLMIGFLGLMLEFKTPGLGVAGLLGALSLALFFGSHLLVGLAGWEELILLGVGVVLLAIEIFVVPGFGIFGLTGIVAVLGSIYFILVGTLGPTAGFAEVASTLSASLLLAVVTAWALGRVLIKHPRMKRSGLLLGEATTREAGYVSVTVREDLVGRSGVAVTDLRPAGTALVGDERIDVVTESGWIEAGTPLRVVRSEGYRHVVRAEG